VHVPPSHSSAHMRLVPGGCAQVGQPMVRVTRGKLQLGVVVEVQADTTTLLVAIVVPSRITPDTTIDQTQVRCARRSPGCLRSCRRRPQRRRLCSALEAMRCPGGKAERSRAGTVPHSHRKMPRICPLRTSS
jgi:hypothetical protein